jgi:hypothetical protein
MAVPHVRASPVPLVLQVPAGLLALHPLQTPTALPEHGSTKLQVLTMTHCWCYQGVMLPLVRARLHIPW